MITSPRALTVFISYASEDEALREELEKQLAILRDQDLIRTWHKQRVTAGQERAEVITAALEAAELILLLISPDFLASGYLRDVELMRAMERHEAGTARVIPIILRPCLWRRGSFAKLQALPTDGEPVTSLKWPTNDAAFLSIAQGIATVAD